MVTSEEEGRVKGEVVSSSAKPEEDFAALSSKRNPNRANKCEL